MGQIQELNFLLGKRVKVKDAVKVCYQDKKRSVAGILTFIGENKFLNFKLQATIDRMPIELSSLDQIELIEEEDG